MLPNRLRQPAKQPLRSLRRSSSGRFGRTLQLARGRRKHRLALRRPTVHDPQRARASGSPDTTGGAPTAVDVDDRGAVDLGRGDGVDGVRGAHVVAFVHVVDGFAVVVYGGGRGGVVSLALLASAEEEGCESDEGDEGDAAGDTSAYLGA